MTQYKYEKEILEQGIYFKNVDFESGCYDDSMKQYNKISGMQIYQHPLQLFKLCEWLEDKEINTYVEIGTWFGGMFVFMNDFLRKHNNNLVSYGYDVKPRPNKVTMLQEKYGYDKVFYRKGDCQKSPLPKQSIDLCFIDGDHHYENIKADFERFGKASKYVIFHDILAQNVPDCKRFWDEIKDDYESFEIIDQYPNATGSHFGYGILICQ